MESVVWFVDSKHLVIEITIPSEINFVIVSTMVGYDLSLTPARLFLGIF